MCGSLTFDVRSAGFRAKASYDYEATQSDGMSLVAGNEYTIVDRSDSDWWKTEKDGLVYMVPASYLEVVNDAA